MTAARARLGMLAVAVLFSTGGVAIKWTVASALQVASLRSAVAALALALLLRIDFKRLSWRVVPVACAYAATMILFVSANKLTTAANTIFLQATAPLYLAFLAPWLLGERLRARDLRLMLVLAAGLACFFVGHESGTVTAPDPLRGNLLAALAGVTWALTILGLRWLGSDDPAVAGACLVVGNAIAFLACLPFALPIALSARDGWVILFLGSIQIALAYFLMTHCVARLPALESSLLLLVEPALNPLWTWWLLGERAAPLALVGGAIVLLGTAIHLLSAQRS